MSENQNLTSQSKKLVVFLFPSKAFTSLQEDFVREEFDENFRINSVFDKILQDRYLDNGYDFAVATYQDEGISGITIHPSKVVRSEFAHDDFYRADEQTIMQRYSKMATSLDTIKYDEVIVGGYHSTDCVAKLTRAINQISNNASIDVEMTNEFINLVFNMDSKYNITGYSEDFDYKNRDEERFERFNVQYGSKTIEEFQKEADLKISSTLGILENIHDERPKTVDNKNKSDIRGLLRLFKDKAEPVKPPQKIPVKQESREVSIDF